MVLQQVWELGHPSARLVLRDRVVGVVLRRVREHDSEGEGVAMTDRAVIRQQILGEIHRERERQISRYGLNEDITDGTGPEVLWLGHTHAYLSALPAHKIEQAFRREYDRHETPTWMHLVREEVAEAFMEADPVRLEEELIQVAALCVSWVESLRARTLS